jgi:subtilase family serine protease
MKLVYLILAVAIILSTACITVVQPGATAPGGTTASAQKPAAFIDRISPSSLNWGESVNFSGHGTAASGSITAYLWRSSVDGDLGSRASFDTTQLSPGKHIVLFSVQDSSGNWSLETQGTVNVITEAAGDTGTPPPADTDTPPPADPGSGAPAPTPPVINSFNAAPAGITAGSTSTLSWDVGNAVAVTIDHGVGSVGLTGTRVVSPAVDTTYTLTAANTAYFGQATVKITVAAAAASKPDLIIEDIWKVGTAMYYRIKNQGTAASPVTWSDVKVDGVVKAQDAVAALAAGAATTRSFAGYVYTCSGISDSVVVTADVTNVAMESNGANNSMTKTFNCILLGPLMPPLVSLKPDLTITQISFSPAPLNRVSYTVKNIGTLNTGAFDVKLYVNSGLRDTSHIGGGLVAGSQATFTFPMYHHVCVMGTHSTMKVVADTGGAVTESDETNNSRSEWWGCPPMP